MTGTSIYVGAWVQCLFPLLVVDDVKCSFPDDNVCEFNCVGDVIVLVTGKNESCNKSSIYEAVDNPDGILI